MQTTSERIKSGNELFQTNDDTPKKNPLYVPEIAEHVFKFLKLSDVTNCRSVCQKWNQLALNFIKELSAVNILNRKCLEKFNAMFPITEESQIFTSFEFGDKLRGFDFEWPLYQFGDFCRKWHNNLREITLVGPNFGLGNEDLSPFLPSTLTKLKIESFDTRMIISTDKICNIKILELKHCILKVLPGTTLNSVEIDLGNVKFREEGKKNIKEFLINPLLNFDVLKKAHLRGKNIMLDMQGSHSLEMLTLWKGVKVLNWETSNWEIKKLYFRVRSFEIAQDDLSKSQIKYKELEITLAHLNVSFLPEGIEKLEVNLGCIFQNNPPRIYGEHNFPDLKNLHLKLQKGCDFSPLLTVFKHCPKLTTLTVSRPTTVVESVAGGYILKTSSVPPSLKTLRVIRNVRIIVDQNLQLESLILHDPYHGEKHNVIVELAKEFHVKDLSWFEHDLMKNFGGYRNEFYNENNFAGCRNTFYNEKRNLFKSLKALNLDNFMMGDLSPVSNSDFQRSGLYPFVDTQGNCYLFRRGEKGKAISDYVEKLISKYWTD